MVEEDRYCIDISTQLMATEAILRRANREVVAAHMHGCLLEAIDQGNSAQKVDELMKLIDTMTK